MYICFGNSGSRSHLHGQSKGSLQLTPIDRSRADHASCEAVSTAPQFHQVVGGHVPHQPPSRHGVQPTACGAAAGAALYQKGCKAPSSIHGAVPLLVFKSYNLYFCLLPLWGWQRLQVDHSRSLRGLPSCGILGGRAWQAGENFFERIPDPLDLHRLALPSRT